MPDVHIFTVNNIIGISWVICKHSMISVKHNSRVSLKNVKTVSEVEIYSNFDLYDIIFVSFV